MTTSGPAAGADASPRGLSVVGVVIPCFNQGRFASESVASLHGQDYTAWRAVLIDDASTDAASSGLCRELQSPNVRVVCLDENLGRSSVRNRAVAELGDVDYVLMLDCDDKLSSSYVRRLVEVLDAEPSVGLAYGTLHFFGERDGLATAGCWPTRSWSRELMYLENVVPGPGTMFRRRAIQGTAGWRRDFNKCSGEDFDIALQVLERGWQPAWVREATYHYRQHADSYLATRTEDHDRMLDLHILRHHWRGIRRICGLRSYLRPRLMPFVLSASRRGNLPVLSRVALPLVRLCPVTVLAMVMEHYARRLSSLVRRPFPGPMGPER